MAKSKRTKGQTMIYKCAGRVVLSKHVTDYNPWTSFCIVPWNHPSREHPYLSAGETLDSSVGWTLGNVTTIHSNL